MRFIFLSFLFVTTLRSYAGPICDTSIFTTQAQSSKYSSTQGTTTARLDNENRQVEIQNNGRSHKFLAIPFAEVVLKISLSPNEQALLVFTDRAQRLYRVRDLQLIYDMQKHPSIYNESITTYVSWSKDGTKMISFNLVHGLYAVEFLDLNNLDRGHFIVSRTEKIRDYFYAIPKEVVWSPSGFAFAVLRQNKIQKSKYLAEIFTHEGFPMGSVVNSKEFILNALASY